MPKPAKWPRKPEKVAAAKAAAAAVAAVALVRAAVVRLSTKVAVKISKDHPSTIQVRQTSQQIAMLSNQYSLLTLCKSRNHLLLLPESAEMAASNAA